MRGTVRYVYPTHTLQHRAMRCPALWCAFVLLYYHRTTHILSCFYKKLVLKVILMSFIRLKFPFHVSHLNINTYKFIYMPKHMTYMTNNPLTKQILADFDSNFNYKTYFIICIHILGSSHGVWLSV